VLAKAPLLKEMYNPESGRFCAEHKHTSNTKMATKPCIVVVLRSNHENARKTHHKDKEDFPK
jgi:hypothetical protein